MPNEVYPLTAFPVGQTVSADRVSALVRADAAITTPHSRVQVRPAEGPDPARCVLDFDVALPAAQKTALDAVVAAYTAVAVTPLATYKTATMARVDAETSRRIALGFVWSGKTFSLSMPGQLNLLGARQKATEWAPAEFPIRASTLDNQSSLLLLTSADVIAFFDAAVGTAKPILAGGNTVKENIRLALTNAAVDTAAASWLAGGPP